MILGFTKEITLQDQESLTKFLLVQHNIHSLVLDLEGGKGFGKLVIDKCIFDAKTNLFVHGLNQYYNSNVCDCFILTNVTKSYQARVIWDKGLLFGTEKSIIDHNGKPLEIKDSVLKINPNVPTQVAIMSALLD